ncbi:delta subunit of GMP phosphodiesterase [Gorgonomyces haynaldii]|nr:delta subunit of GMP phosphodiesterase [Gorgonomyces haynaldii]
MGHELFQFLEFKMSDDSSVLYHAKRPQETLSWHMGSNITTHYEFPKSMLSSDTITTQVVFAVGEKPLERLRMIERHYYGDRLLRSYDFEFGFCIPNTVAGDV